jgi:hypothetical protein
MRISIPVPPRYEWPLRIVLSAYFLFFVIYNGLFFFYASKLKTTPNPALGSIYPLNMHGHIVYLNHFQHQCMFAAGSCAFASGAIFGAILLVLYLRGRKAAQSRD